MLERKPFIDTAQEWQSYGPHEERPLLPAHVDPQIHASRIDRDQPVHRAEQLDHRIGEGRAPRGVRLSPLHLRDQGSDPLWRRLQRRRAGV